MFNNILIPLDGSEMAENALGYVNSLTSGDNEVNIILLRIIANVLIPVGRVHDQTEQKADIQKELAASAIEYLNKKANNIEDATGRVRTFVDVRFGDPAKEILECANRKDIDLILMVTHTRSGIKKWALGSITDSVVRHSTIPVLVIPSIIFQGQ